MFGKKRQKRPKWKLVKKTITWPNRKPHVEYHLMTEIGWPVGYQVIRVYDKLSEAKDVLREVREIDETKVTYEDVEE